MGRHGEGLGVAAVVEAGVVGFGLVVGRGATVGQVTSREKLRILKETFCEVVCCGLSNEIKQVKFLDSSLLRTLLSA